MIEQKKEIKKYLEALRIEIDRIEENLNNDKYLPHQLTELSTNVRDAYRYIKE